MHSVYLIQSKAFPEKRYVGYSTDFEKRLEQHNLGRVSVTKSHIPWEVVVLTHFKDMQKSKGV